MDLYHSLKRHPSPSSIFIKMRHNNNNISNRTSSSYRYFKFVIWVSLILYFFTTFLINKPSTTTSLHITTVSSSSSRSLIQSDHTQSILKPIPSTALFSSDSNYLNDLKIYVYELPATYNTVWLANPRCSNHLFASEVAIHKAILNSKVRTFDPYEADFFFVPVYVSCNFSTVNGFPALGHAKSLISSAVELVSKTMPFWNRSDGSDHVFVASHDYGACFHAMEDRAVEEGVPEFMKNSIVLQTFGVKYHHPCQEVANVVIPPYVSPAKVEHTLTLAPANGDRDIFAFFRGKMEVHPKNISGRFYSKRVRTLIWDKFNRDKRFYLRRHRFDGYQSEIVRSTFCLCPLGWAPWSPRLVESVVLGCIPVIIADGIRLPFESTIPWKDISLTVAENDVVNLGEILKHVAETNVSSIQRNLWRTSVRNALMFNDEVVDRDATWQTLSELLRFRNRSRARSQDVVQ